MTPEQLRPLVLGALATVTPESDLATLDASADVREALDLDSMDVLRFATQLHARTGVDVPEADYPHIVTIDGCVAYLATRASLSPASAPPS